MPSQKTQVVQHLYQRYAAGQFPQGIVSSGDVIAAIQATGARLGQANPANFIKDMIRGSAANRNWPNVATQAGITARQKYGGTAVFQFVPFTPGQTVPFPDRFVPTLHTPRHILQSVSLPSAARELGRQEESWVMQVVVALRLVETHLSLFSPLRHRLRDVTHLQMSMKTQPEIDAVFLMSHSSFVNPAQPRQLHTVVTCEAKRLKQRILEDQIREQVAKAFEETQDINQPTISAIKPMALQVCSVGPRNQQVKGIYTVEFQRISRTRYEATYSNTLANPDRLYDMPLNAVSEAVHVLSPPVKGINR